MVENINLHRINDNPILSQPSWVPNWSEPRTTHELDESLHAGANSEAEVAFPIDGVLRVTGCMVGGIDAIEPFELSEPNARPDTDVEVAMEVRRVIQRFSIPDLLDQRGLKMRSLCRLLLSDRFSELYVPPDQNQVSIESTEQTLRDILTRPTADFVKDMLLSTSSRRILKHIFYYCFGRGLIKLLDGTLGLAYKTARRVDKVVVWLGCYSAMVVRPFKGVYFQLWGGGGHIAMGYGWCGHPRVTA